MMHLLPGPLGSDAPLLVWRLENARYFADWQLAEGAYLYGGRWNTPNQRILYTSADPATTILESAVHKGFQALDQVPHKLLAIHIASPTLVHVVPPDQLPQAWLLPGLPAPEQQAFGDTLTATHPFVLVPSVVSTCSWNLLINVRSAASQFSLAHAQDFAIDPRLKTA